MHQVMESLCDEMQINLQSQVDQLKEKLAQLEGEAACTGKSRKVIRLEQRCDTLHHTNALLLKRKKDRNENVHQTNAVIPVAIAHNITSMQQH